jgi:peptidoglycan LD-endopeptidase CwlK
MDKRSLANLATLRPELQKLYTEVDKRISIVLTDGRRGRIAQTQAFRSGHSKVKFGDSAHNWTPSIACDAYPAPFDPKVSEAKMTKLAKVIKQVADELKIPIRQGIDFDRDGNWKNDRWRDLPHTELFPWREWAKKSKLFEG